MKTSYRSTEWFDVSRAFRKLVLWLFFCSVLGVLIAHLVYP